MLLLLSSFFFVSGFLAFDSFHRHGSSLRNFFKPKIRSLYIPFLVACLFYFSLEVAMGAMRVNPSILLSRVLFLNMLEIVNSRPMFNWGILWYIPYLLVFMLILCLLEKYVKNVRLQVVAVLLLWLCAIAAWAIGSPLRIGQNFSQYLIIFMFGFWINKIGAYERLMKSKFVLLALPCLVLFSLNFSSMFTFGTMSETFKSLCYSNARGFFFGLSAVLVILLFLRKLRFPSSRYVRVIASASILIYLMEPFVSYLLNSYIFEASVAYLSWQSEFGLYHIARIALLLVILPFAFKPSKYVFGKVFSPVGLSFKRFRHYVNQ